MTSDITDSVVSLIDSNWDTNNTAKPSPLARAHPYQQVAVDGSKAALHAYEISTNRPRRGLLFSHKNTVSTLRIELMASTSSELEDKVTELARVLESNRLEPITGWSIMETTGYVNTSFKYTGFFAKTITIKLTKFARVYET